METIDNARVLRVSHTKPDSNGNTGAVIYVQDSADEELYILEISGRDCPYDIKNWVGRNINVVFKPSRDDPTKGDVSAWQSRPANISPKSLKAKALVIKTIAALELSDILADAVAEADEGCTIVQQCEAVAFIRRTLSETKDRLEAEG